MESECVINGRFGEICDKIGIVKSLWHTHNGHFGILDMRLRIAPSRAEIYYGFSCKSMKIKHKTF